MADDKDKATEPTLEDRVAKLTEELAAERALRTKSDERAQVFERTLSALSPSRPPASEPARGGVSNLTLPPLAPETMQRLKSALGQDWTDDEVRKHYGIIAPFLGELAGPIVQQLVGALGNIYERVDYHDVALDDGDYKKYKPEVEQERKERLGRGEAPMSRKELTQIVKARHFADEVTAEATRKLEEEKQRVASAGAAETEGATHAGTAKVQPSVQSGKIKQASDVDRIPDRDGRVKAIEAELGDQPIP